MLTRLILGFSHLREPKFNTLNPLYSCSIKVETTTHYFLRGRFYNLNLTTLVNDLENIPISFSTLVKIISLFLYGNDTFDDTKNRKILMSSIQFINNSQKFGE